MAEAAGAGTGSALPGSSSDGAVTADIEWDAPVRQLAGSRWFDAQKARARKALSGQAYDVLVVPVQAGPNALDHRARAVMTYSLAQAIAARSDLRVADPALVARYFGLTARQTSEAEIDALAADLGVSRILIGTVVQDGYGRFALRMRTVTLPDSPNTAGKKSEQVRIYAGNTYSDTSPPGLSFRELRDGILEDSGIRLRPSPATPVADRPGLPASIGTLLAPASPEAAAYALQLLGVLVPPDMPSRTRDQLFERSLVLSELAHAKSHDYDLLMARALLYLGRRPAAVALLGAPEDDAERALLAYADGNLEALTEAADRLPAGIAATLARIERERLRLQYGGTYDPEQVNELLEQEPLWGPLLVRAVIDNDTWRPHSHAPLKLALDNLFPMQRFDLEAYAAGKIAVGEFPEEYDLAALLLDHLDAIEASGRSPVLPALALALSTGDITEIYRELVVADVRSEALHIAASIGKPRDALELLERYEPLLADHPALVGRELMAYRYLAPDATGPEKDNVNNRIRALARRAIELSGALTPDTVDFAGAARWLYPDEQLFAAADFDGLLWRTDWPQLPDSNPGSGSGDQRSRQLRHCLAYTMTDLRCLESLYDLHLSGQVPPDEAGAGELLVANAHRFVGHPKRLEFMAEALKRTGGPDAADQMFSDAIKAGTTQWVPYEKIGRVQASESQFANALETVLRYPGFQGVELEGAVAQSNRAYQFGSMLYWAGAYEEAATLYEIAAATQTGSGAEMGSAQRLALIDGDYDLAQHHASRRIRRYQDKYAVRDLIGLSVIAGDPAQAWSIVNGFQPMFDQPELWDGALIAHRADDRPLDSIVEWGFTDGRERLGSPVGARALRFAFLAHTLDRPPPTELGAVLRARQAGLPPTVATRPQYIIGRDLPVLQITYSNDRTGGAENLPDSLLVQAADAMVALGQEDYRTAFARLDEATRYYELREFLPMYAWASAKVGETKRLEAYLTEVRDFKSTLSEGQELSNTLFDENLAEAMLLGAKGQTAEAIERLKAANAEVVHNQDRNVLTRYQILDSARLLYADTGERAYRDFALDLARRNAVIEPMQAYTHSFVAMLSTDRRERVVALARVLVLDPQSRSVARADTAELSEARALATKGYPLPGLDTHAET